MVEKFATVSGDLYVGMKYTDCKTEKQRKEFSRVNQLDGKIGQALSGEDICRERDRECTSAFNRGSNVAIVGTGIFAAGSGADVTGIGAIVGISMQIFGAGVTAIGGYLQFDSCQEDKKTEAYKKQYGIKY